MGDEPTFGATNAYFAIQNPDGTYGEFQPLGDAVRFSLTVDSDERDEWADTIASLPICTSFQLDATHLNKRLLKLLFGERLLGRSYTIRELKRYGKSAKRMRKARGRR